MKPFSKEIDRFIEEHAEETLTLLRTLAAIPAPSGHEERRAAFCLNWLQEQGADAAYIDAAGNVLFPFHVTDGKPCVVISAHMDVVFPDTDALPVQEDARYLYAPGVGDDTANLVNLLLCIKYVLNCGGTPTTGILFAANTCEEGLGNLRGTRQIFRDFAGTVTEMLSLDLYLEDLIDRAVGSRRYRIEIHTTGGHSYENFGNPSAVAILADLIHALYRQELPSAGKTTYNVGTVSGGTSVNAIAEYAECLYEFRSDDESSLACMEDSLQQTLASFRNAPAQITLHLLGDRPCSSASLDAERLRQLTTRQAMILEKYTGAPVRPHPSSTDANIPLSLGIPAVTFGTVRGSGLHTRAERIEKASLIPGQKTALASVLAYFS
ncbi:MAG: M20/M25/M40 family metallo-hydrolase [Lachnospiraceae bacterium]|nr:M20/M25/M40 family metallo-hydrolase [Lachnospiraceae bacterium]